MLDWVTGESKPNKNQLVIFTWHNECGKIRYSLGYYVDRFSELSYIEENYAEYKEDEDQYYLKQGWYEKCHDNCEYLMMYLNHNIIAWAVFK